MRRHFAQCQTDLSYPACHRQCDDNQNNPIRFVLELQQELPVPSLARYQAHLMHYCAHALYPKVREFYELHQRDKVFLAQN